MVTIRHERPADVAAREALLDVSYGPARFTKTSERLREGRMPALACRSSPTRGRIVGTVRLWQVSAGRPPGAAAWPARRASGPPQPRHRLGAGAARAAGRRAPRPWRRAAGRRCPVLRPFRLFQRKDRRAVAARTLRAASPARLRARARRARRRARARCAPAAAAGNGLRTSPRWLPASTATRRFSRRMRREPVVF